MQLFTRNANVRALQAELVFGLAQHALAKAVVLADQVHTFERLVVTNHLHERGHAHVGMGVKAKVPEAAFLVGERRVYCRIVQKQHAFAWLALVVFVDGVDQRRRRGRRVALQHKARAAVDGQAQVGQRLLGLALAVHAIQHQHLLGRSSTRSRHAAARVDAFYGPSQVAKHGFAAIGVGAAQAFDQSQFDGCWRLGMGHKDPAESAKKQRT